MEAQVQWRNKKEFLSLPLGSLDALNVDLDVKKLGTQRPITEERPGKKFS